jgi:hypothetical protein
MLVRFRQELKRCHGAGALIYSLRESKTGFTGTTASGAKRPFASKAFRDLVFFRKATLL